MDTKLVTASVLKSLQSRRLVIFLSTICDGTRNSVEASAEKGKLTTVNSFPGELHADSVLS